MTPKELTKAGELLIGQSWKRRLAERLGISHRSIRRYLDGSRKIDEKTALLVMRLIADKFANTETDYDEFYGGNIWKRCRVRPVFTAGRKSMAGLPAGAIRRPPSP